MQRVIKKVAVLGSGVMGSRIACHFANIGVEVLLLDIAAPPAPQGVHNKPALGGANSIVNAALQTALKSNPSPIYDKAFASRITTGNFDDDLQKIETVDWIIEVIIERLDIKQQLFEKVDKIRKVGSLVTSNTSGIPIHLMTEGRSDDFKKHFCGSHFFNPPRYLKLLEIIPTNDTEKNVVDFLMHYGAKYLGKTTVEAKDTPAFIANRIGVYGIMSLFHLVEKMDLTIDEVDKLTGTFIGRPKSATFRTCDVVGLDTLVHVANGLAANCPNDEAVELFALPNYIKKMVENKWLGSKTEQGFFKKIKLPSPNGEGSGMRPEIHSLNLKTLEYSLAPKVKFATLEAAKTIENLNERLLILIAGKDKAGDFYRATFYGLFAYVSNRIPEIADDIYKVDDAMCAGFGWELGPFELWDALGIKQSVEAMKAAGIKYAAWIDEMLASGNDSFYKYVDNKKVYYQAATKSYSQIPGADAIIALEPLKKTKTIWSNAGASIIDLGDGIINLEFHSKMNTIGAEVIAGIHKAIDIAEKDYNGLVIYNNGANFSAGANLGMVFMFAVEQEWDELNFAIKAFQNAMMRVRYSSIPVVSAPHNMALGGGCELSLHADRVQAHAELYMGLVEFGVGVIPGGGGSKEFALRASDAYFEGDLELATLKEKFLTIGMAKVSTSAHEAFKLGYLRKGIDAISINRSHQLTDAKLACLEIANAGYTKPIQRKNIKVLGKQALGMFYAGANSMFSGHYISEHDKKISEKLGFVLSGGDLSAPSLVSEQYLLDLEREAFLSLCGEKKTLERMQSILTGGKVLRN
jgi:3-hydroxyacyl-CoA dehydrogenase